jgi:hypothetical protein
MVKVGSEWYDAVGVSGLEVFVLDATGYGGPGGE